MTTVLLTNGVECETGCYVDGHWGWRGIGHMIDQARVMLPGVELERPVDDADGFDPDYAVECSDTAEEALNAVTPEGFMWHWHDGEFFLSPFCGDPEDGSTCADETCACHTFA